MVLGALLLYIYIYMQILGTLNHNIANCRLLYYLGLLVLSFREEVELGIRFLGSCIENRPDVKSPRVATTICGEDKADGLQEHSIVSGFSRCLRPRTDFKQQFLLSVFCRARPRPPGLASPAGLGSQSRPRISGLRA